MKKIILAFILFYSFHTPLFSQDFPDRLVSGLEAYKNQVLQEKVFVHTDRSFYLTGEYLWFNAYNVEGSSHENLNLSKVAYVEVIDKEQKPVLQTKISLEQGTGQGSLFLPASLPSGQYTFRVYTRWMRNFDPAYYFSKTISIVNPFKPLAISAQADSATFDLQFFPEGGRLVNGLRSKVAFRVVDQSGKGIDAKGLLLNDKGDTLSRFRPLKFGLGHFYVSPLQDRKYTVILLDSLNHTLTTGKLPEASREGYVMHLKEEGSDQLQLTVTSKLTRESRPVYLLVHTRQNIQIKETGILRDGAASFRLSKTDLGQGVSHFTLFDHQQLPVCERLFFKRPENSLSMQAKTDRSHYTTRQQVKLDLLVQQASGEAAKAKLSLSVYRIDSLQGANETDINSYLMLASDLKGNIESPAYYMGTGREVEEAADHLMLTHGWRRFSWADILKEEKEAFKYLPDYRGQLIEARLVDSNTGKPAAEVLTYLSRPGRVFHFRGARSDQEGRLHFELRDFYGEGKLILQTNYTRDSLYRIELSSPFSSQYANNPLTPLSISEKLEEQLLKRSINMQLNNIYFSDSTRKPVKPQIDSIAFYGKADEQYFLDDYTRFPVMEEVIREYVLGVAMQRKRKNFHLFVFNENNKILFQENPMVLLDGVPVFDINKIMAYSPLHVQKLEIIKKPYFYGPLTFKGILNFKSYQGDFPDFELHPSALSVNYEGLQWKREFFAPVYEAPKQAESPLPDFRDLLHWAAEIETNEHGGFSTHFFTSGQTGNYLVMINGISPAGQAGSAQLKFKVTPPANH